MFSVSAASCPKSMKSLSGKIVQKTQKQLLTMASFIPPSSPLTLQSFFVVKMCTHSMFIPAGPEEVGYSA